MVADWNESAIERVCASGQRDGIRMPSQSQYRDHAAQCLALAEKATNAEDRARLLMMAQAWNALADKLRDSEAKPSS